MKHKSLQITYIFTNVECEPSPIIELNDTIPSSDNGTSSRNTTDLIDQSEHILEEGYQKPTKLNNLLRKPQNDSEDVYHPAM